MGNIFDDLDEENTNTTTVNMFDDLDEYFGGNPIDEVEKLIEDLSK